MSVPLLVARALMRTAGWIAPRERSEWLAAMVGELGEIGSPGAALSWAGGCLAAATGWRLWAELPYAAAAVLASAASTIGYLVWWWLTPPPLDLAWVTVAQQVAIVGATLGVGLVFPRRVLLSAVLIVTSSGFGGLPRFIIDVMASAGTLEKAVGLAPAMALFVAENGWPALLAALLVAGWANAAKARSWR
ncbi:hypothetical protein [Caulobacter sp. Root1455]|uniref:hypothetical protein n=1 Tax=Caulobacter sp. Root1455 TaxID=1736465 RepID=UPI0006F72F89|nr:hypothetical protein [Caulobacter sp. Root1455]